MTEAPSQAGPSAAARAANLSGAVIRLRDGREVTVTYTLRGLAMLEDQFGSLLSIAEAVSTDGSKPLVKPLCTLLAAGLLDYGISSDDLLDLLEITRLREYVFAAGEALNVALPVPDPTSPQGPRVNGTSPGATFSVEPSGPVSRPVSSGE